MCFAGFKATGRQYNKAPDTVMASKPDPQHGHVQHLRVVGEIKVPLVEEHTIRMAFKEESDVRHLLPQPIMYNSDGDIKPNRWPIGDLVVLWAFGLPFMAVYADYYILAGSPF
ncbi:hypothetical protein PENNAL_c0022G02146 [Penicillium nalgiovense]|uniref:Uncharacterized protein n=1 Tax=Penicillium nalgiovense TaxID=60175 RepID=A0A1V6YFP4_PENNA|nr:hypothetical protein PENNAL_c0022G02146 [Penicillium nalgiovense]